MSKANLLDRRQVVSTLLADRKDALVVAGLGASTYDLAAAGDHARNFYLWGAMGGAVMIGLGLALAQPDLPVVVVTGDGEMLMGMGSLATVGVQKPKNLSILVLDNEAYGETGGQPSHTSAGVDLVAVARGCGFTDCLDLSDDSGVTELTGRLASFARPLFARVAIKADEPPRVLPEKDGVVLKRRFRAALGLEPRARPA